MLCSDIFSKLCLLLLDKKPTEIIGIKLVFDEYLIRHKKLTIGFFLFRGTLKVECISMWLSLK